VTKSYSNGELIAPLNKNVDFDEIGCISLYCEEFTADLGHLVVKGFSSSNDNDKAPAEPEEDKVMQDEKPVREEEPEKESPLPEEEDEEKEEKEKEEKEQEQEEIAKAPGTDAADSTTNSELLYGLQNCKTLIPDYLNVYWTLEGDAVKMALEGRPGAGNKWMAFGYSSPEANGAEMVGSTVVAAGFVRGTCFAFDYYLSSRDQCDFSTGNGVCPEAYINGSSNIADSEDRSLECDQDENYMSVYFERPLASLGGTWPIDASSSAIYAMGPVSEASTAGRPVVLYHSLQLPGEDLVRPVNNPPGKNLVLALDASTQTCQSLKGLDDNESGVSSSNIQPVAEIKGVDTFVVTTGSNLNYPNPPGWGLSYHINGEESPVLYVQRGKPYTFQVEAGPTHPLYLTSSIIGAGLLTDFADEEVYGGGGDAAGTKDSPYSFVWTPDESTPDLLYYQCALHQKLGWEIQVVDEELVDNSLDPSSTTTGSNTDELGDLSCTMEMNDETVTFQACTEISGIGDNFFIAWNLSEVPENPAYTLLTMGMNASLNSDYVAVGFPKQPEIMLGASALILSPCEPCTTGAILQQYYLGERSESGVQPSSQGLDVYSVEASRQGDTSVGMFTAALPQPFNSVASRRRSLLQTSTLADFNLIYATGGSNEEGTPLYHSSRASNYVDLSAALTSGGVETSDIVVSSVNYSARTAHMWLMSIGWGILIPLGILGARAKKELPRYWFNMHRIIQSLGFAMGLGGIGAGFAVQGQWETAYSTHRDLGITITVLGAVQVLSLVARPGLDHKYRWHWEHWHRWIGRCTAILAIANIYYGMIHVAEVETWAWAVYTAILGLILLVALLREYHEFTSTPNKEYQPDVESLKVESVQDSSQENLDHDILAENNLN